MNNLAKVQLKYFICIMLGFFSLSAVPVKDEKSEMASLAAALNTCKVELESLHRSMLHVMPEGSYMLYRKVILLSKFCKNTLSDMNARNFGSGFQDLNFLSNRMKTLLKETPQEVPYSIGNSPDRFLFDEQKNSFLWPKTVENLVGNSLVEVKNQFNFERNKKSVLSILLDDPYLQPRAVVRARVQQLSSPIQFHIESSPDSSMQTTSVTTLDGNKPSSLFLNGQFFEQNRKINLDRLCAMNHGTVGIDLGDAAHNNAVQTPWDNSVRLEVARQFAMSAFCFKSCNVLRFKAPKNLSNELNQTLTQFKSDYFGLDNELLLSNKMPKKILVIPGRYRMIVTSILSGETLSAHEFDVEAGTYTTVNARVR